MEQIKFPAINNFNYQILEQINRNTTFELEDYLEDNFIILYVSIVNQFSTAIKRQQIHLRWRELH